MTEILIVGAGLSGAVVARILAEAGIASRVVDARNHVAGNCHTKRCAETGVLVHVYGPHIFHTDDEEVWGFVNRFGAFRPYVHRVRAQARGRVYTLPVNLLTINQVYGATFSPAEARAHLAEITKRAPENPQNFEEAAERAIGPDLYALFFRGYTKKQWGIDPKALPVSVFRRLPIRFTYDDRYFNHKYQAMPVAGYTAVVEAMLDHPRIDVELNHHASRDEMARFRHVFYTGPLDAFFDFELGRLGYRTLDFEHIVTEGDFQGCAVMNYCDEEVPFTRITEHKHFAPWEQHEGTVATREYSRACGPNDIPYYPIRLADEKALLSAYVAKAKTVKGVTFLGRLGTYRYIDMDVAIREALDCAKLFLAAEREKKACPVFCVAV